MFPNKTMDLVLGRSTKLARSFAENVDQNYLQKVSEIRYTILCEFGILVGCKLVMSSSLDLGLGVVPGQ